MSTESLDSRTLSIEYSPAVVEELRAAGWEPGRSVDVDGWVAPLEEGGLAAHTAARAFLAEFGGLRFMFSGPGVECAREPFLLDPSVCEGEEEVFLEWGEELALSLFPIGERAEGVAFLAIDEHGAVISLGSGIAATYGQAPGAFEKMLLGYEAEVLGQG
ncbi:MULTISPECIES: SUKH-3 domain-containing protein [unclassified Streptomyces]|uniref:SUKH-3 domain-containing protein n=1 Tax=unclassified Streptomyces TaxID=2593676 RepID=UPI0022597876|nr:MULTISPECIES: SUKH-3 domain-containing protein [unclassified Streptomyces]MCX5147988.1 SUKH-3 domain-containing protein [Streptomyces sp. NBC_00320]WSN51077.1 SUKH-3 domain-containing protein [Streptomyces sp. NBC_01296]